MNGRSMLASALGALSILFVGAIGAAKCEGATIRHLLQMSDAVVIGRPISLVPRTAGTSAIGLAVSSWITGGSGDSITVLWQTSSAAVDRPDDLSSTVGIWFVRRFNGEGYVVVPAHPTAKPKLEDLYFEVAPETVRPPVLMCPPDSAPAERIALELLTSVIAGSGLYRPGDIAAALAGLESGRLRRALAYLSERPESRPKAIGVAGLIGLNDPAGLTELENGLSDVKKTDLAEIVAPALFASWRNPDPTANLSLGRMLTKPDVPYSFVFLGAKALSYIHSRDTLPYLVKLLDSKEREVKLDAVNGLWMFANGVAIQDPNRNDNATYLNPRPTPWSEQTRPFALAPDDTEERISECIGFWRAWWEANQKFIP